VVVPVALDIDDVDDDVDLDVDLDSSVELDGSEAIRRRLTPPLTLPLDLRTEPTSAGGVDTGDLRSTSRSTVVSTSSAAVDDSVRVKVYVIVKVMTDGAVLRLYPSIAGIQGRLTA
jgi:hypothetical protein